MNEQDAYEDILRVLDEKTDDEYILRFLKEVDIENITVDELFGFARGMKEKAKLIKPNVKILLDTCGTGGDAKGTFNVSTIAAIIAASADIPVAKHGNYAITSKCGSADVLEKLGYNINMNPEQCKEMIEEVGFGFLFAPNFYPAMERVNKLRKQIEGKTMFNLLGPLCNPADANIRLIGVYDESLCEKFCHVLRRLGVKRAMVVYGSGLDEISNIDETKIYELDEGPIYIYKIKPEQFGFKRCNLDDISGGSPEANSNYLLNILNGKEKGARRDLAVLNAGAAIYLGYGTWGVTGLEDGVKKAEGLIDSLEAMTKFRDIIRLSEKV